jgi:hypothetical protein
VAELRKLRQFICADRYGRFWRKPNVPVRHGQRRAKTRFHLRTKLQYLQCRSIYHVYL